MSHPVFGQSWEGFALENIVMSLGDRWRSYFYRSEKGNKMDLVLEKGRRRICIEFKASSAPKAGKGLWIAREHMNPEKTWIAAPVESAYPLDGERHVWVGSIDDIVSDLES